MEDRRSTRGRSIRAGAAALGAVSLLVLSAGPAAAAPADSLTPLVDCIVTNDDGSWTAVLGYVNGGSSTVSIPVGRDNKITPDRAGNVLPTRFEPGRHRGAGSVTVDRGAGAVWHLGDDQFKIRSTSAKACPPPTEMPAEGNGTGIVVALGAAGVIGAVFVRGNRRRAGVLAVREAGPDA
jgi:hypothetical protein